MPDTISRLPGVTPSYPVNPTQPAEKEKRRQPSGGDAGRRRRRVPDDDTLPSDTDDGESPAIDEYI